MTPPRKPDPVEPLLMRDMFATDEEFFSALIRLARTGQVTPFEPAPPRPPLGPISRKALGLPPEASARTEENSSVGASARNHAAEKHTTAVTKL